MLGKYAYHKAIVLIRGEEVACRAEFIVYIVEAPNTCVLVELQHTYERAEARG